MAGSGIGDLIEARIEAEEEEIAHRTDATLTGVMVVTRDGVREFIREHNRRLAARLREEAEKREAIGCGQPDGQAAAPYLAASDALSQLADILEADDA